LAAEVGTILDEHAIRFELSFDHRAGLELHHLRSAEIRPSSPLDQDAPSACFPDQGTLALDDHTLGLDLALDGAEHDDLAAALESPLDA
jgi:hypothetical protein